MLWRSASGTGDKPNQTLRLSKQLEFIFRDTDTLTRRLQRLPLPEGEGVGEGKSKTFRRSRDVGLESKARGLLLQLGASELAREIRVEWNPRMRTAAGRADYREKLISLNPTLLELRNPLGQTKTGADELDCLKQSSLTNDSHVVWQQSRENAIDHDEVDRTLRHELAHLLAQWRVGRRRIAPHGPEWRQACRDLGIADEARCHNLPFATKAYVARYVYVCPNCKEEFPRIRKIRRAIACLACCRKHNRGDFDLRFRLKLSA